MEILPHSISRPLIKDWIFALLSLALAPALIVASSLGLREVQRGLARGEILNRIALNDSRGAHEALDLQAAPPPGLVARGLLPQVSLDLRFSHGLVDLLAILESGESARAASYLEGLLVTTSPPSEMDISELKESLEKASGWELSARNATSKSLVLVADRTAVTPRFVELQTEFSRFLGLVPTSNREVAIEFYTSGVLIGLPTLESLPDEIPDLQTLRFLLSQRGGRVDIAPDSRDPRAEFDARVGAFAERARRIREEVNRNETAMRDLTSSITHANGQSQRFRDIATQHVMTLIKAQVSRG